MNEIRASIAMAVYNGELYLKEQLDSICSMMGDCDELIISYDTSMDKTLEIIKEYERCDSRIHVYGNDIKGVEGNFNNAVKYCNGKYIFLSDQDDVWINDKINKVCSQFEQDEKVGIIISNGFDTNSELEQLSDMFSFYKTTVNPVRNFIKGTYLGCQMAFRCELKALLWPVKVAPPLPHDLWLGVSGSFFYKVKLYNEYLILHRLHEHNFTKTSKMNFKNIILNRLFFLCSIIELLIKKRNSVLKHNAPY